MYQGLKNEIKDIIGIVKQCPESLQEKCFELLLENYLKFDNKKTEDSPEKDAGVFEPVSNYEANESKEENQLNVEEEIVLTDFHIKIRKFLETNGITIKMINSLYYKEDGKLMPLYETLNSNKMTDCQNRIALLTAFENSFSNGGEMVFNGEVVRQRCQDLKCYDAPHFADTFKRFSSFFDNWTGKYDKKVTYSLSVEGKKELVNVLLELVEGE